MALISSCVAAALCAAQLASAQASAPAPLDAIATIVDAFKQHAIVGLEEEHGDARGAAFRLALIRDPRFAASVNDIVVEFGNAQYQDVIDRFVNGETIPHGQLRRVWQDTTVPQAVWDRPIYEDFFQAVRAVNQPLPRERRLRVLLGDPAFEWRAIQTREDLMKVRTTRARHPADVILREVLPRGRRALVIYGAMHLLRQNAQGPNLTEHVEKEGRTAMFIVVTHPFVSLNAIGVDPASWPIPSIALTRGRSLANQLDAILYLGPKTGRLPSRLSRSLCDEPGYREMRISRMVLAEEPNAAERIAAECAQAQPQADFTGSWTPDPMPPAPPPPAPKTPPPPPRTIGLTIVQSATELKIDRRLEANGRETVSPFTYKLDGTVSVNQAGPIQYATTAAWEGATLILSSKVSTDEKPLGTIKESYSLENGQLIVGMTGQTPAGTVSNKSVYKKV